MIKIANIRLRHGKVDIIGPPELVLWLKALDASPTPSDPERKYHIYMTEMKNWHTFCSVTREPVSIADLKYWNVEKGEVYKSPEIMPLYDRYQETPKPEKAPEVKKKNKRNRRKKKK